MAERRIEVLARHLEHEPEDAFGWVELARGLERGRNPRLPRGLDLTDLARAWAKVPRERALARLALPLVGLEPTPDASWFPGEWWVLSDRADEVTGEFFDEASGFPLRARDPASGLDYLWIPGRSREVGYYVSRHPVTVAAYRRFLAATGHREPLDYLKRNPWEVQLRKPERPVVLVGLADARAFAAWSKGRIPSGEEWEHFARGEDSRAFPWGNERPSPERSNFNHGLAWRGGDWDRYLDGVGLRPEGASPFGIEDMAGNVAEWTEDPIGEADLDEVVVTELACRDRGKRVVRGGSWAVRAASELEVGYRGFALDPSSRTEEVGFRVVKEVRLG